MIELAEKLFIKDALVALNWNLDGVIFLLNYHDLYFFVMTKTKDNVCMYT